MSADAIEAGREMDAEVAERVGDATGRMVVYEWADRKKRAYPVLAFLDCPEGWRTRFCRRDFTTFVTEDGVKLDRGIYIPRQFSADAAASLTALDKLSGDGWYRQVIERTPRGWEVGLDNGREFVTGQGDTLALAASRAALNAVGKP